MRPVTLRAALVLAVLSAVLVPALATGSSSRDGTRRTLRTIQQTTAYTSVDADHDGKASIGDYSVAQVVHLDPTTRKQIGAGVAICTQVAADGSLFDCQGSDVLPGGELREAGRFTIGKTWRLSILGGSGRYDGASGSVDGAWLNSQLSRSRDVFTINRD